MVQDDVGRIRMWQQQWNFTSMPLYITESGADFALRWNSTDATGNPRGRPRPARLQGRAYAYGVAAHQIENIAIGVDRTYAFNFLYYEEGGQNYGLIGQELTPLRGLAAYSTAVWMLQNKYYVGDLPNKDGPEGRARVFANVDRTEFVAAIFAGSWSADEFSGEMRPETPPAPMWSYSIPIIGAFGADGRDVPWSCSKSGGCQWGNYDKLGWVTLTSSVLRLLDSPTLASSLNGFGRQHAHTWQGSAFPDPGVGAAQQHRRWARQHKPAVAPPPVILQMVYDNNTVGIDHVQTSFGSTIAYTVSHASASTFNLTILLHSLDSGGGGHVSLEVTGGGAANPSAAVIVPPGRGASQHSFLINITQAVADAPTSGSGPLGLAVVDVVATGSWGTSAARHSGAGGSGGHASGGWEERLSLNFEVAS